MLAAKDQGVDTMIAYEIVKYPEEAREVLQISSDEVIAIGIAAGYPADSHINQFRSSRVVTDNMFKVFE